jgi:hypothetical protein
VVWFKKNIPKKNNLPGVAATVRGQACFTDAAGTHPASAAGIGDYGAAEPAWSTQLPAQLRVWAGSQVEKLTKYQEVKMDNVNHSRPVLTYPIASGGPYYAVVNHRTVYVQGDPETGFSLYGEIPGGSEGSVVNLAKMLLEFAMAWNTSEDIVEARHQMQRFGKHLGEALAKQRTPAKPVNGALGRAAEALEDVFRSLDASYARRRTDSEVCYQLDPGPLHMAAEVTTSEQEVGLAHHALKAICQNVVGALDPELRFKWSNGFNAEQVISVVAPTGNGR